MKKEISIRIGLAGAAGLYFEADSMIGAALRKWNGVAKDCDFYSNNTNSPGCLHSGQWSGLACNPTNCPLIKVA
jgi:hypothetical protein